MRKVKYKVDFSNREIIVKSAMQNDSLTLEIEVLNNGEQVSLADSNIELLWVKPDNFPKKISENITLQNNKIIVNDVGAECTSVSGICNFELTIKKSDKQISTFPLTLKVIQSVINNPSVENTVMKLLEDLIIASNNGENVLVAMDKWAEEHQDLENIADVLSSVKNSVKELSSQMDEKAKQSDLNVLEARVDNIIATAGDSTIPSELSDIRVNYKGKTFTSANSRLLNTEEKIEDIDNKIDIISENLDISTIEPSKGDIPKLFFTGDISGMSKDTSKDLKFEYISKNTSFSCIVEMKWQGNSSLSYPKKNFNIKLYEDEAKSTKLEKSFKNWGKTNKYCLKANYIDHTHSRNIVSANIASLLKNNSKLPDTPNNGYIDGFPIKLYVNGIYQGLYTLNIPKGGWMFGMDKENPNHLLYSCKGWNNSCVFKALSSNDDSEWCEEFPKTGQNRDKLNKLISFVKDSSNEEFKNNFELHFNKESVFNYFILMQLLLGQDNQAKNMLLVTYDGEIWYTYLYDLDSTAGLKYDGSELLSYTLNVDSGQNLLWTRIRTIFGEELELHYKSLSSNVLSKTNFLLKFENFINQIPKDLYAEDLEIFPNIPSPNLDLKSIRTFMVNRIDYINSNLSGFFKMRYLDFSKFGITAHTTNDSKPENNDWATFIVNISDDFTEVPTFFITKKTNIDCDLILVNEQDSNKYKCEWYHPFKYNIDNLVYLEMRVSTTRCIKGNPESFRQFMVDNFIFYY